jgi:cyclase
MLKTRVIPTLLWKDFGLVKGKGFDSWRRVGTVLPSIKVYNTRDVDELILVDITATSENREPEYLEIASFCEECFVPMTVGGGIQTLDHIKKLLRSGADKVCINSQSYQTPDLITQAADKFGSQCVVASVDVCLRENQWSCASQSGKKIEAMDIVGWCQKLAELGAGEILLTSVERDGTMTGYDLKLIEAVSSSVKIPVIASGGCGSYEDMYQAVCSGASAVAAAAIFHFTEQTPKEAKKYLNSKGIPVRLG